jgi:hypothetical protein
MINWGSDKKKRLWHIVEYYPSICLEEMKRPQKISSSVAVPGPKFKRRLSEYEEGVLTTKLQCLVLIYARAYMTLQ